MAVLLQQSRPGPPGALTLAADLHPYMPFAASAASPTVWPITVRVACLLQFRNDCMQARPSEMMGKSAAEPEVCYAHAKSS